MLVFNELAVPEPPCKTRQVLAGLWLGVSDRGSSSGRVKRQMLSLRFLQKQILI
jgi:hypothetical protein